MNDTTAIKFAQFVTIVRMARAQDQSGYDALVNQNWTEAEIRDMMGELNSLADVMNEVESW